MGGQLHIPIHPLIDNQRVPRGWRHREMLSLRQRHRRCYRYSPTTHPTVSSGPVAEVVAAAVEAVAAAVEVVAAAVEAVAAAVAARASP